MEGLPPELQMFDANGRLPMEGFLSNTFDLPIDVCDLFKSNDCQYTIPNSLRFINIKFPVGYNNNPGSYEECLSIPDYKTRYCTVFFQGIDLGLDIGGFPLGRNALDGQQTTAQFLYHYQEIKRISESATHNRTIYSFDPESIKSYLADISKIITLDTEEVQEQLAFLLMSVYVAINQGTSIGICIPKSCSAQDVSINYANLTSSSHHGIMINVNGTDFEIPIVGNLSLITSDLLCYTDDNRTGMPEDVPGINIFWFIVFGIIGFLILIGTGYEIFLILTRSDEDIKNAGLGKKLLLSFSAYTNGKNLMSTESFGSGHLDCLNGIRFISMTWVVIGHCFIQVIRGSVRNKIEIFTLFTGSEGLAFEAVVNALPSVDTFFLMSGTLTAYIFFRELERAGSNPLKHSITFILFYVHRYLRISMLYILVIGLVIAVFPYVYYGPAWYQVLMEGEDCKEHWWLNLLYIQTLVEDGGQCLGVSWYLVDDMVFHWFSPLILYPMYIGFEKTKKHIISVGWWLFALFWFTFAVFYISFTTKEPPNGIGSIKDEVNTYTYHVSFYFAPWARYQAYLIGIILGYVLHHTRSKEIKIGAMTNILLWQLAFLSAFGVVYGLYDSRVAGAMSLFDAMMYNTLQRIAWNGAVAWVIFSCVKGYGGIVNDFLSWSAFAPLSRLTFCAYLIHMPLLTMYFVSVMASFPNDGNWLMTVLYFLPSFMIVMVVAFFVALFFEVPSIRVEKLLVEALLKPLMPRQQKPTITKIKTEAAKEPIANGTEKSVQNGNQYIKPEEVIIVEENNEKISKEAEANPLPSYDEIQTVKS